MMIKTEFAGASSMRMWTSWIAMLLLCAGLLTLMACGGGGSSGGSGGITGPPPTFVYTDPTEAAAGDVVLLVDASSSDSTLVLNVIVYGALSDVWGVAAHLCFNDSGTVLAFQSATLTQTVLDDDACNSGDCVTMTVSDLGGGELLLGISRQGAATSGYDIPAGANHILQLRFTKVSAGTTTFDFGCDSATITEHTVEDSTGATILTSWFAGTLTVN